MACDPPGDPNCAKPGQPGFVEALQPPGLLDPTLLIGGLLGAARGVAARVLTAVVGESVEGSLGARIASTFAGRIRRRVLQSDVVASRFSGGTSESIGRFLTTRQTVGRIGSAAQARAALNLPSGATAETVTSFVIPRGTEIFVGRVAGGAAKATQIFIKDPGVLRVLP